MLEESKSMEAYCHLSMRCEIGSVKFNSSCVRFLCEILAEREEWERGKAAEKLYPTAPDADDPNRAFKGTWPSADLWRQCIQIAGKVSPSLAEEIIAEIPDPEIAAAQKIAFANSLLGPSGQPELMIVGDCRKTGSSY